MRKILLLLAVTMLTATSARAAEFRFNGFAWGTPKADIIATANNLDLRRETENRTSFATVNPYGQSATGIYLFTKNSLLGGAGYIWHPNTSPADMLQEYDNVKAGLTAIYGKPYGDRAMWNSNRIKALAADAPVKGLALGGYCLNTAWDAGDTLVTLTMMSSTFHDVPTEPVNADTISIELIYFSKDLSGSLELVPIF